MGVSNVADTPTLFANLISSYTVFYNVAHHPVASEYTTLRCKDTNFLSNKCQNAQILFVFTTI